METRLLEYMESNHMGCLLYNQTSEYSVYQPLYGRRCFPVDYEGMLLYSDGSQMYEQAEKNARSIRW